ncbi:SIP domain-containing protein [Brachybacterium muris]|uniref:SIP domain-containing protein n=1 Tax=Brachybacterium muris TaxID=219301 RepID=UPI0021A4A614|nr:SIP domain-containing protein [Brachybacterium muris]MCT1998102.1 SIP domain-containing protein [Brachybacterium muris]
MALIEARSLHLGYDRREVVRDLSLTLPEGRITIIVGANGSGKSTLLRGLSRLLTPRSGRVLLDGTDIHALRGKDLARRLGLLPQSPIAPDGVTVRDLVARGRFPHQGLFQQWTAADEQAVAGALAATRTDELQDRLIEELSGGQRQRVWIALALAQQTDVLLLDEPTTFLDVTHQLEVLDVVRDLNRERGTTVGIVLHDLNLAARYADHLVAVRDGEIHSQGSPGEVITEQMVHEVFALSSRVLPDPVTGTPMVLPLGRDPQPAHQPDLDAPDLDAPEPEDAMTTTTDSHPAPDAEAAHAEPDAAPVRVPALEHSPQLAFDLTVAAVRPLGQNLMRVTLTSPELVHFGTGAHPLDLRIKLIVPGPRPSADHFAPIRPDGQLDPAGSADWYRRWLQIDPEDRGWLRTYTVRDLRGAGHPGNLGKHPELDVDMVLHLEPEQALGSGVAARWAQQVAPGDRIDVLGPNRHVVGPDYGGIEFRPGTARTLLLVGDETAAPAICSILEALPAQMTGRAVIEVADESDRQPVLTRSAVQLTWLVRGDAPHGELLDAEVRRLMCENAQAFREEGAQTTRPELEDVDIDSTILWETTVGEGAFYAWLAGEAGVIKGLRRHLVTELGIDRTQVSFMGYWRQGRPEM